MKKLITLILLAIIITDCNDQKVIDVKVPEIGTPLISTTKEYSMDTHITMGEAAKDIPTVYHEYIVSRRKNDIFERLIAVHDFGDRKTLYVYNPPKSSKRHFAAAAIVKSNSGNILAVAKFLEDVKLYGIRIEEFHLNENSQPYYYCKSLIGFSGKKQSESNQMGKKKTEYFALWGRDKF